MTVDAAAAVAAAEAIAARFPGPGGVAGIVHRGAVLARLAWGWADPAARRQMTVATRLPVCSISKQFTCAAVLDSLGDASRLDPLVAARLPRLRTPVPDAARLAHNQSGLRDSWALTTLMGATPGDRFPREAAAPLFATMRTGHFAPGTQYAYSNGNFRLLADLLEEATGQGIGAHYARLFDRWGMAGAILDADTARPADGVVGFEGNAATGWLPARNAIWWEGDAGIAASLDDMLAYETAIQRGCPLHARLAEPVTFADGTPAAYGWGLSRETIAGAAVTGHGGALRGFRAQRFHAAAHDLSVVVMLNHEDSAHAAAASVIHAALGVPAPRPAASLPTGDGAWFDAGSGLLLTVAGGRAHFATAPEPLDDAGAGPAMVLTPEAGGVAIWRPRDNLRGHARPVAGVAVPDIAGRYDCAETGSTLTVTETGPALWAMFDGPLGAGPAEPMQPVGADLWAIWTRRGLDAPAPGRWTVAVRRDAAGRVAGLRLGCWLARDLDFRRA